MRTIKTNPGIGDACWLFQKLINSGEQFRWQIHDGPPQRGKQIFDLLPQLSASCEYVPNLPYRIVGPSNIQRRIKTWGRIRDQNFFLSANEHLEAGLRIETFLPDLPTSYSLPFQTEPWQGAVAEDFAGAPYIGIYASAYSTARNWGFWNEIGWADLIGKLEAYIPDATFVIIGAEWDAPLAASLMTLLAQDHIRFISTIGKPLGYVIEMMKRLDYGFYFPSGLGILSGLLHRPSTMFYPEKNLPKLPRTWCDPELIQSGTFKECFFCSPEEIFLWVKEVYKLKDRL